MPSSRYNQSLVVYLPTTPELMDPAGKRLVSSLADVKSGVEFKVISDKEWLKMVGKKRA